jgi:monovalent cation:H+ antiporter-2, CPA2 family
VLGFILVGVVVGPFGLGSLTPHLPWLSAITINTPEAIEPIARLGVVPLLFMIGLELSFERIWVMRRLVFGVGSLQVLLCAAMLAGAAVMVGYNRISAVVIGLALAMSSTAVVIQVLSEEKRLNTSIGHTSFAILLFQDLAVVPLLFVLGAIAPTNHAGNAASFGLAVGQAFLAVAAIIVLGRLVLRPLFRSVARAHSAEVFVAACLLVVIDTAKPPVSEPSVPMLRIVSGGANSPRAACQPRATNDTRDSADAICPHPHLGKIRHDG